MGQYVLLLVVALTVGAVVFGVTVLVSGGDPGLDPVEPDGRAVPLPGTRPLAESDVATVRFDTALRGYRMAQVDRALHRAAYDIGYKDELISVLEAEVEALRDGRLDDAEVLRQAREAAVTPGTGGTGVAAATDARPLTERPGPAATSAQEALSTEALSTEAASTEALSTEAASAHAATAATSAQEAATEAPAPVDASAPLDVAVPLVGSGPEVGEAPSVGARPAGPSSADAPGRAAPRPVAEPAEPGTAPVSPNGPAPVDAPAPLIRPVDGHAEPSGDAPVAADGTGTDVAATDATDEAHEPHEAHEAHEARVDGAAADPRPAAAERR